jgi:hypothetical protein
VLSQDVYNAFLNYCFMRIVNYPAAVLPMKPPAKNLMLYLKKCQYAAHFEQNTLDPKGKSLQTLRVKCRLNDLIYFDGIRPTVCATYYCQWSKWYGFMTPNCNKPPNKNLINKLANTPALLLSGDSKKIALFYC